MQNIVPVFKKNGWMPADQGNLAVYRLYVAAGEIVGPIAIALIFFYCFVFVPAPLKIKISFLAVFFPSL